MRAVYEKGNIRKVQYAQNDSGAWFCRTVGGKRLASRWGRCRHNWTPNLEDFIKRELEVHLPKGIVE